MSVSSPRQAALAVLLSRVQGISADGGYQTDAGEHVFFGETPLLGPDDGDAAVAIVVVEDEPRHKGINTATTLPVEVQALAKLGQAEQPWLLVEAIVADIKRAVENDADGDPDHSLGGTVIKDSLRRGPTRPLEREEGSEFVGAAVTYRLLIGEKWGGP